MNGLSVFVFIHGCYVGAYNKYKPPRIDKGGHIPKLHNPENLDA